MFGLFKKRKKSSGLPPEMERVFENVLRRVRSEEEQNAMLPPFLAERIKANPKVDQIPGSTGEFGLEPTNPIPVNGPFGEVVYLSTLAVEGANHVYSHRLGSIGDVDVFEVVGSNGEGWAILYFNYYFPSKSNDLPRGFRASRDFDKMPFFYSTLTQVENFPKDLPEAIAESAITLCGAPLRPPRIHETIGKVQFVRPHYHRQRLDEVKRALTGHATKFG